MAPSRRIRILALAGLAMIAFAANSVIARLALRTGAMDAASFTSIRIASGAFVLVLVARGFSGPVHRPRRRGSWVGAAALFLYATPFSFAYQRLTTATGALILFGFVQITMILSALVMGERPSPLQWLGLMVATGGLVYLLLPGLSAPPLEMAGLMAIAGVAWGVYSVLGKGSVDPLAETAGNFVRALPLVAVFALAGLPTLHADLTGIALAFTSGALASGLGYAIWYAALRGLSATNAAVVQLSVPVLAAIAGVVVLAESISYRLVVSAFLVLGGIAVAIAGRTT